jgi:hypothetical protein
MIKMIEQLFERLHIKGNTLEGVSETVIPKEYQNLIDFIGEFNACSTYLHTTETIENAKSICENGLNCEEFGKTTDYVHDISGLIYMLIIRKDYGNFTLIIQLNKNIENSYESICKKEHNENGDEIFVLPPQYIKGYYDRTTKEIFANLLFIR